MKIALFGAKNSGKTSYFSGMYLKHNCSLSTPILNSQTQSADTQNNTQQCVMQIRFNDIALDKLFHVNADRLIKRPIEFPEKTDMLNRATITAQFDFMTLMPSDIANRSHERQMEIYDPPGEAFSGEHRQSQSILGELSLCDLAIAFIPSNILLDEVCGVDADDDILAAIRLRTCLNRIYLLLEELSKKIDSSDIFPVCFVLSKYDLIPTEKDALMKRVFFEQLLMPFSGRYPQFVVCGCTTSLRNPEADRFRSANLAWPFLFAAGGAILRNSYKLKKQAGSAWDMFHTHYGKGQKLKALKEGGFWSFIDYLFEDGIYEEEDEKATRKYHEAQKIERLASDDAKLASEIWSMISAERRKNIRVFKSGQAFDPCLGAK